MKIFSSVRPGGLVIHWRFPAGGSTEAYVTAEVDGEGGGSSAEPSVSQTAHVTSPEFVRPTTTTPLSRIVNHHSAMSGRNIIIAVDASDQSKAAFDCEWTRLIF